ncbi:MAG: CZB domain-containing protein [Acidobacteriaceae bacterium]
MDFAEAIKVHSDYRMKLRCYVTKPDHSLIPAEMAVDNRCALGEWLYGEGRKYSGLPEYERLMSDHATFHKAAADVIERADRGICVDSEIAVGSHSSFALASSLIVATLTAMKVKVRAGAAEVGI